MEKFFTTEADFTWEDLVEFPELFAPNGPVYVVCESYDKNILCLCADPAVAERIAEALNESSSDA